MMLRKGNLHFFKRYEFDKAADHRSWCVLSNINLLHVKGISIWMLLCFSDKPHSNIQFCNRNVSLSCLRF